MKVVYIIGPFRASTAWKVAQNVRRAEALALEVARAGAMPLCPHTNTAHFHGLLTEAFWLEGTMELARRCDAAILVDGWETSAGGHAEYGAFYASHKPVFSADKIADLRVWVAKFNAPKEVPGC